MKNFKFVTAVLPLAVIAVLIYFSTVATVSIDNEIVKAEDPSENCQFDINISSLDPKCLSGSYAYCVNGGTVSYTTGMFTIYVPCGRTATICVWDYAGGSGCRGSIVVGSSCPCAEDSYRVVYLSDSGPSCNCIHM